MLGAGAAQAKKLVSEPQDAAEHEANRIGKTVAAGGECCGECLGHSARPESLIQRARGPQGDPGEMAAVGGLGNAALLRLLGAGAAQAKKLVSEPEDAAEQQADRAAKTVAGGGECCGECLGHSARPESLIQRTPAPEGNSGDVAAVQSMIGGGRPLDPDQRSFFEQRLGVPLDHARVHTDGDAAASAKGVGAQAYTLGSDVVFAPGQYAPETAAGRELLAHELAHVAQQAGQPAGGAPALVQRQAAPAGAAAAQPAVEATPQRPSGQFYYYRGVAMAADREFMRGELRRLVARVGLSGAVDWYDAMLRARGIPPEQSEQTALGITAHTLAGRPRVRSPIDVQREMGQATEAEKLAPAAARVVVQVYPEVYVEAVKFLVTFEAALRQTLLTTLGESENRIQAERIRYGITRSGDPTGHTEYKAENTVAFQGLVGAAKDLLAIRERIDATYTQQHMLMPPRGSGPGLSEANKPRYGELAVERAKLEVEYAEALAGASLRYPALGAVLDETSFRTPREQLARVASGELTSKTSSQRGWRGHVGAGAVGEVLDSRQWAIDKVRDEVADDPDQLWQLESIVALTKMRLGTSRLPMADKLIADKIQQIKADEAFLAIALGVLAFALAIIAAIPTAGASLAATAAVTAAAAGSLAISGYQLVKDIKEYQLQMALTQTDLNRRAQAIATEEPSMFWVALDLVFFIADGAAALKAFRALKTEVRAAVVAREGMEATEAAGRLEQAANAVPGAKPGLGRKLLDSLAELRGRPKAARELGKVAEREAGAVAKASEAIAEESKHAATIANVGAHEVKVTRSGHLVVCTDCSWLRERFARELAENADLLRRVEQAEAAARKAGTALDAATKAEIKALSSELEQAQNARILAEGGAGEFPNKMGESLGEELTKAAKVGAIPIAPGTKAFDAAIQTGRIKWVVLPNGELRIVPKWVKGQEIPHSVLSGGGPVRAAGEAEIAGQAGHYIGMDIDFHSGHFHPSEESLEVGRDVFRRLGIVFP